LVRLANPNLFDPCMMVCREPWDRSCAPARRPFRPFLHDAGMSRSPREEGTHLDRKPGVCEPSGPALRNFLLVPCFDQSVRMSTQAMRGNATVLRLPLLDDRLGNQEVRVAAAVSRHR